jgi:hypothetical protein
MVRFHHENIRIRFGFRGFVSNSAIQNLTNEKKFKEMKYGVRAGVKNLKNTYFSKGKGETTLIDLFKK